VISDLAVAMGAPLDQYDSAYTSAEASLKIKYGENKNKYNILNPRIELIINKQYSSNSTH
jgi:hypothetical protein